MAEFEGAGILVTGGTTGLGLEVARRFVAEGARVVITGRDPSLGAAAEAGLGRSASFLRADAADPDAVEASVADAVALLGGLDVLVNNAGIGAVAGVLDTPLETYDAIMDVNVRGAFCYARAAFPHLAATGGRWCTSRRTPVSPARPRPRSTPCRRPRS
jgi:NAD(P)-dependent dehydrogenase (short-subunit alcohol dehydrogenase family)